MDNVRNTVVDKKAKYEAEKEQERKRRFTILSGHIKSIQTTINLKEGEHAYYQVEADRKADSDIIESHTTGDVRSPFIKGGILRGNSEVNTKTTQSHSTYNETIDSGIFLFTNLRVLFIGKQVISIPYNDILTIEYTDTSVIIKYPNMVKNESYYIGLNNDSEFYYQGLMRKIGKDKTEAIEAEVAMNDYPRFISEEEIKTKTRKGWIIKFCVWIALFFIISNIFRNNSNNLLNFATADILIVSCCAASYFILKLSNRYRDHNMGLAFTKWLLVWSSVILLLSLFEYGIIISSTSNTATDINKDKQSIQKKQVKLMRTTSVTPSSQKTPIENYEAQITKVNQSVDADVITDELPDISSYGADQVKTDLQNQLKQLQTLQSKQNMIQVPPEMTPIQPHYVTGLSLLLKASSTLLKGITNSGEVVSAKNLDKQAHDELTKANNLLFTAEEARIGSFATMTFDNNGVIMKDNFDVPITDCTFYMDASSKNWSNGWDYHESEAIDDENNSMNITPTNPLILSWQDITDGDDQPTFNYPPSVPYYIELNCQVFDTTQTINQTME